VIQLAEQATGQKILNRERFYALDGKGKCSFIEPFDPECFVTCHIDGCYENLADLHEGKTTSAFVFREKWGEPGTDRIPRIYQVQAQHQCMCTGAKRNIVSVLPFPETPDTWEKMGWTVWRDEDAGWLIANEKNFFKPIKWASVLAEMGYFHQYPVDANPAAQTAMLEHYRAFWTDHVLAGIPPEPRDYDDIKRMFPEPVGTIVADATLESWLREYKEIGEEISATGRLGKRREELKVLALKYMRLADSTLDDESRDKTIVRDQQGHKLIQWNGKVFR
jgi:hypothetical protein